jgi:pimeloyl-ACP methyl ester carboxylesterase
MRIGLTIFISAMLLGVLACSDSDESGAVEELWRTIPAVPALPQPDETGRAPVNDISMYYEIWNAQGGDPVILVHGGIGSTMVWANQVPELMKNHKVIAADSRGHGRSTRSSQPFSYDLMTSDLVALMDYLKIQKASVVGWSDGAIIGINLAIRYPKRLNKLFAFGALYNAAGEKPNAQSDPVVVALIERFSKQYKQLSSTPDQFDAFRQELNAMYRTQPDFKPDELGRITVQTVVAVAQYDELIRPEHTSELAKLIPAAKLVMLPDVSHMALWQDAATFNKAMADFLNAR